MANKLTCLPPEYARALRESIDSGSVDIEALAKLSTADRRKQLGDLFMQAEASSRKNRKAVGAEVLKQSRQDIDDLLTKFNKGFEERIVSSSRDLNQKVTVLENTIKQLEELKAVDELTPAQKSQLSRSTTELNDLKGSQERMLKRQTELLNRYVERELAKASPKVRKRTIDKINELNYLLEPGERQVFLEELITARFGFSVTEDTRKTLLALSKDSADAISAARAYYAGPEFTKLKDFYKTSNADGKKLANEIAGMTDPEQKRLMQQMFDVDAENYAYEVMQGWRAIDDGAPLTKADQVRIQKELLTLGLKSQRLVDFIGYQQRAMEWMKYSGIKDEVALGEYHRAFQLGIFKSWQVTLEGLNSMKSILASIDISVLLRQGLPVLFSNPKEYFRLMGNTFARTAKIIKSGRKSREDVVGQIKAFGDKLDLSDEGRKMFDEYVGRIDPQKNVVRAEIAMRPNSLNGKYDIPSNGFGLNVLQEEAFPASLPSRTPVIGRFFAASEFFFESASLRWRANMADKFIWQMERKGVDWTKKEFADELGLLVSALTGRGLPLGTKIFEGNEGLTKMFNAVFFSPRFTGSRIYFWTTPFQYIAKANDPIIKLRGKQFASVVLADAALLGMLHSTAKLFWGDEAGVEFKPDSPFFGSLKFGNYAYDFTGALGPYVTLVGKMYGARNQMRYDPRLQIYVPTSWGDTAGSTVMDFFMNKLSPGGAFVRDLLNGHGWGGEEILTVDYLKSLMLPLSVQIPMEVWASNDGGADALLVLLGEMIGVSSKDRRITPLSQEWKELKQRDSEAYWEAVDILNAELWPEIERLRADASFQELPQEEKDKEISRIATRLKNLTVDDFAE